MQTCGYYLVTGRRLTMESAYRSFYRALKADPQHPWAWEGLANLLDIDFRFSEAEHAARRAVRFGSLSSSKAILARVLAQRGKGDEARVLASEAKTEVPDEDFTVCMAEQVLNGEWDPLE